MLSVSVVALGVAARIRTVSERTKKNKQKVAQRDFNPFNASKVG